MEDEDIPAVLPTSSPKEPENGGDVGDNNGRTRGDAPQPDAVVLQEGLQPTAARSDRDGSCGAHVSTEIRVLKAGRDLRVVVGSRTRVVSL